MKQRLRAYSPPCQLPSPRMHSAWTLVMRRRFSVSERLLESCASCECSWVCTKDISLTRMHIVIEHRCCIVSYQLSLLEGAARGGHRLPLCVLGVCVHDDLNLMIEIREDAQLVS